MAALLACLLVVTAPASAPDRAPPVVHARAEPPSVDGARATWLVFAGLSCARLATASLLWSAVDAPTLALHVVAGGFVDVLIACAFGITTALLARAPGARVWRPLVLLGAGAVGLVGVVDVYPVLTFGALLNRTLLGSYAREARVGMAEPRALAWMLAAACSYVVAARVLLVARPSLRGVVWLCACVTVARIGAQLGTQEDTRAGFGLHDSALVTLLRRDEVLAPASSARIAFDAPVVSDASTHVTPLNVSTAQGRPRHVVLWLGESTGARYLSAYGAHDDTTPNLRRLQQHAATFTQAVAGAPISIKSIVSTLCGLYPMPEAALETTTIPRIACPSLPQTLAARGYDAALFHGGYFAFTDKLAFLEERGFSALIDGENHPHRSEYFTNGWGIDDAAIVDEGLSWLDDRSDRSRPTLSVFVSLYPHYEYFLPPAAPRPFGERDLLSRYRNGLRYQDAQFGRLVDGYAERGLLDDTLFVFMGDHGEAFDQHPRNRLHGGFLYEENLHVPLLFINTRLFPGPQTNSQLATHADLLPTILDLLGQAPVDDIQGHSLAAATPGLRVVPLSTFWPEPFIGIRDQRFKFIHDLRTGADELYDLEQDPGERRNIARIAPARTDALRARSLDFAQRQPTMLRARPTLGVRYLARVAPRLGLPLVTRKVFNMSRDCLAFRAPPAGKTTTWTLHDLDPMPATIGIGIDDDSRFTHRGALHATVQVDDVSPIALDVNERFEESSVVRALPGGESLRIVLHGSARGATGCLWFSPNAASAPAP